MDAKSWIRRGLKKDNRMKMNLAIDFDGVICKRTDIPTNINWTDGPNENALDAINHFLKIGHNVWVFTSNPEPEKVKKWLDKYGFPELEVTNIKKPAHAYIDDRAIRFTNWNDIRRYFG